MIDDGNPSSSSFEDELLRRPGAAAEHSEDPSEGGPLDRLPPPAFPPGQRRTWVHRPRPGSSVLQEDPRDGGSIPQDALYAPDAPIRRIADPGEMGSAHPGSGDLTPREATGSLSQDDVADLLMELARQVRNGRTGRLLWNPGASPLEGAIRGLLAGYFRYPGQGADEA